MTTSKPQNLVIMTGLIMTAVALYADRHKIASNPGTHTKQQNDVAKQLLAIWLFVIATAALADYAPSFTTPFTLLVLVIYLTKRAPVISDYFNNSIGKK